MSNSASSIDFSQDVPPDGGGWSVSINSYPNTDVFLLTKVPATTGSHVYRLSVWSKRIGIGGSAGIIIRRDDSLFVSSSMSIGGTEWSEVALIDTILASTGDSVGVILSGGISLTGSGTTYFDRCALERL
jgi:hypothetical protein